MCGIFGWYITDPNAVIDGGVARQLTDLQSHRGPDSFGYFETRKVFLGHRRLKVIDLSDNANQPLWDDSKRYCLIFNGEIYNYKELRSKLEPLYRFCTQSDAEVLLYAYKAWGNKCVDKLLGMFAFCVFDKKEGTLFIGRDHLGQKPLYYTYQKGHLIFASELQSLILHPEVEKKIDQISVMKYHIYDTFPFSSTPIKNVKKLLPGHCLTVSQKGVTVHKYWESVPVNKNSITFEDAVDRLDELLSQSLRRHTRTDVAMGVFLSGGIDSSLVTHYVRQVLGTGEINTFSVGVDFPGLNEIDSAQSVNKKYRCTPHIFSYGEDDVLTSLDEMCAHADEPLADPGIVNSYFISKKASKQIKVALAGDGGDELFGGYLAFKAAPFIKAMNYFPHQLIMPLFTLLGRVFPVNDRYMSLDFRLKQFAKGVGKSNSTCLPHLLGSFTPSQLEKLYRRKSVSKNWGEDSLFFDCNTISEPMEGRPLSEVMLYQYQKYFLPEFVLAHTDRASMRYSLEVRAPLLDKPIIEFANSLPTSMKIKSNRLKKILFSLGEKKLIPSQVINQPKKGFTFPVSHWLKNGLKERLTHSLLKDNSGLDDVWSKQYINRLINDHMSGRENNYRELWNLFIFTAWKKKFGSVEFY